MRVLGIARTLTTEKQLDVTQLRLGRIIGEEQKGRLDKCTDQDIEEMLIATTGPEVDKDRQAMAEIKLRQGQL